MSPSHVLLDILVVLVAAKLAAEVAERLRVPAVVAEILAGVLVGPSVLDLVGGDPTLQVLGELGVILLLLQVGMELDLGELGAVGRAALTVATIGVAVPMASGFGAAELLGYDAKTALFLGAALSATSVGITARVFSDLRAVSSTEARTVLGAAVADDVLGLVILTVVVRIVTKGSVSATSVAVILLVALAFLVGGALLGRLGAPKLFEAVHRHARATGTFVALGLAFTLGFAQLAEAAKLAPIVGAFLAGLSLSRGHATERFAREIAPLGHLFVPVFFLQIGIETRVGDFGSGKVLELAGVLLVCAVVGKLVAALGARNAPGDSLLIGLGMLPRGEVGLIFASIGLQTGVLGRNLYASIILVVLSTTLIAPPLLRWRLQHVRRAAPSVAASTPAPPGGWLTVADGIVDLTAEAPRHLVLSLGLAAAAATASDARPGPHLREWLGAGDDEALVWSRETTAALFDLLRRGDARPWRFLQGTGLLDRALPELAEALARRPHDPFDPDPLRTLRFETVGRLGDVVALDPRARAEHEALEHPERLTLAALVLDVAGDEPERVRLTRDLARRFDLGAAAEQELALLVDEPGLLHAVAARTDGLEEEPVLQLAGHLEDAERARALYLLTLALDVDLGLETRRFERDRLHELLGRVLAALEHPETVGREARNLLERRRQEAIRLLRDRPDAVERIEQAPRGYLLTQEPAAVARQTELLAPLPPRGHVRVAMECQLDESWRIDVASRDRPGLLAHVTGALAELAFDVSDAVVATWPDGGALDTFRCTYAGPEPVPDSVALERAVTASFASLLSAPAVPDATFSFDDQGSPWFTLCEVRCADRAGLLHAIATAFATAGVDVHSARAATIGGSVVDRFELTDRNGRKLGDPAKAAVATALVGGVTARRRFGRTRRVPS